MSNKIEIYRKLANMTQEELSKKAKIDRSNLSKIENGKYEPNLKTLKKLASALDCKTSDLLD